MTDKKEKILETALELMVNDGFGATSTSKIARILGVSEGLIFRHFAGKKELGEPLTKDTELNQRNILLQLSRRTLGRSLSSSWNCPYQLMIVNNVFGGCNLN